MLYKQKKICDQTAPEDNINDKLQIQQWQQITTLVY